MKALKLLFAIMFLTFALVQYNDLDPYLWIPIYTLASVVCLLSFYDRAPMYLIVISMGLYAGGFLYYAPSLLDWFMTGMPSITGTMKAENSYIELVRESLGLLICFFATSVIFILERKKVLPSQSVKNIPS